MENNSQRLGVGSKDHKLAGPAGQRLGGLVGALLQLAIVAALLDKVEDFLFSDSRQPDFTGTAS